MKTYLINCIKFLLFFFGVLILGLMLPNKNTPRSIDYSILQKHKILDSIKMPKIILTGGSNVLFGFNSKIIADSLKMPVVNHAIHAGYGLKYILDDVSKFVKSGDVIILSPEYSHFLDDNRLGSEPILFSLTAEPKNIQLLSIKQLLHIAPFIPKFSFDKMKSFAHSSFVNNKNTKKVNIYSEFAINKYGDNHTHWNLKRQSFKPYKFIGTFNTKSLELIERFENKITKKGATLFITYPSLCKSSYLLNISCLNIIKKQLEDSTFKILGKQDDFIFTDDYFFDTPYHLTKKGAIKRTKLLIKLI
ncbi:hypothetical protein [Algibacter sp. L1A34]|uniref:hypothetical protein n=1 Tax=Algibacter sp. L1A34 TaxID=2686365 RepID=UPI00131C2524|nr:hypothetical protein [Algibacter sp. L1A34]